MPIRGLRREGDLMDEPPAMAPAVGLSPLEKFFFVNPLRKVYSRVRQPESSHILERLLNEMRIQVRVTPDDLMRIPQTGAALVVANHPFGILDGAVLGALLTRIRKDVKMLSNYLVSAVEELRDLCIYLDPFARASSQRVNACGLRQAVAHLRNGGLLAMFPAGEVSHWQFRHVRRRERPAEHGQTPRRVHRVLPAMSREALSLEIESLSAQSEIDENRDFRVLVAEAGQIPRTMIEVGRQRELAFREAGEGTGQEIDLDRFDAHYKHLILWHKKDAQVAGGYRFASTADVLPARGLQGLYTSTLFWIDPELFDHTGPALELGRSFIRREYQKQYAPLLMLWKGIARYVAMHPQTPILFGPVSISSTYNRASRELLIEFFKSQRCNPLSQWIRPKRPFRSRPVADWELRTIRYLLDVDEMSSSIAEIESDGKRVPVLLRQYLKLGGELLGFNVDKNFSNVLDGLVLVDLRKTEPVRLEAYMGKDGMALFHNAPSSR